MKVVIVGKGAWGKALQKVVSENHHTIVMLDKEELEQEQHFVLPSNAILILAVPTQAIRLVLPKLKIHKNTIIVNCAKGIEQQTHKFPYEIVQELVGTNRAYFSLIGPSFAQEVMEEMPTLVSLGFTKDGNKEVVERLFETEYFRVRPTKGVEALELAAAFKNVYAIAAGVAEGLGFGMNTRVKVMVAAFEELSVLAKQMGFPFEDTATPGILGDLILTCSSTESRNFTFGKLLVSCEASECLRQVKGIVEGFYTAASVSYFANKTGAVLPLALVITKLLKAQNRKEIAPLFTDFAKHVS